MFSPGDLLVCSCDTCLDGCRKLISHQGVFLCLSSDGGCLTVLWSSEIIGVGDNMRIVSIADVDRS